MIDPVATVRFLSGIALAIPAGALLVQCVGPKSDATHRWVLVASTFAGLLLAALQLLLVAGLGEPGGVGISFSAIRQLVTNAWTGQALAVRLVFAGLATLFFLAFGGRLPRLGLALAAIGLLLFPISGHAGSAAPAWLSLTVHGIHAAAAGLWLGGLLSITLFAWRCRAGDIEGEFRSLLALYSPWALRLVAIAVSCGLLAAVLQLGRPAALFGTSYGRLLILKAAILLPLALACAAWLRFRYLPSGAIRTPLLPLLLEALPAFGILLVANIMSQGVPGRHDDILWPFPFRFDWTRVWTANGLDRSVGFLLVLAAALLALSIVFAVRQDWFRAGFSVFTAAIIPCFSCLAVSVPAYPTTYATSPSRFAASPLADAAQLFHENCTACHGEAGRGDGKMIDQRIQTNADLTAKHTGEHTGGDLFWWISHGTPSGRMPGFAEAIDEQGRWDLVSFVRLLTASHQSASLTGEIDPGNPWLPSIDFDFFDDDGNARSLREFEPSSPVLLVIARDQASLARLQDMRTALPEISAAGLTVIFVCGPELASNCIQDTKSRNLIVLRDKTDDIISVWTAYRRTGIDPDDDNVETSVPHLEFLIDRFGYVRARWRTDEGLLPSIPAIIGKIDEINVEPQIRPSPESISIDKLGKSKPTKTRRTSANSTAWRWTRGRQGSLGLESPSLNMRE